MVFFRDEEQVDAWCTARALPRGPSVTLEQLWALSRAWYSNRLDPEPRRRSPGEVRSIFAAIGLTESFWDPEAASP